jgi:GT2 family glycosyltransferase
MSAFTIVICTHNRAELLTKALQSLNEAVEPERGFDVLVIANACSDDTPSKLEALSQQLPGLRWCEESRPGKSHALNRALKILDSPAAVFVDDDHRVAPDFLVEIQRALDRWPEAGLLCGRIKPDWDGSEPDWVHERGPYPILPRPIPAFDAGEHTRTLSGDEVLPGGGNLIVRSIVFASVGEFDVALGPTGHNLGGAEDGDFIRRALAHGFELRYVPGILQFHAVNRAHLKIAYLMRKSFQRSRAVIRIRPKSKRHVPGFLWRKLIGYTGHVIASLASPDRRRYYLVRLAAVMGEIRGWQEAPLKHDATVSP